MSFHSRKNKALSHVLKSGTYEPHNTKTVTVWPMPDANGDGEEVWIVKEGPNGEFLGRDLATDGQGRPIRHYLPPAGFTEIRTAEPGADGATAAYVRVNPRTGRPLRNHLGQAIGMVEGAALVEHGDGTFALLLDDWSKVMFDRQHRKTDEVVTGRPGPAPEVSYPEPEPTDSTAGAFTFSDPTPSDWERAYPETASAPSVPLAPTGEDPLSEFYRRGYH